MCFDVNKEKIEDMANIIRERYGYTQCSGNGIEYHPAGCIAFALLGTEAASKDKLTFDPSRKKRIKMNVKVFSGQNSKRYDYCILKSISVSHIIWSIFDISVRL